MLKFDPEVLADADRLVAQIRAECARNEEPGAAPKTMRLVLDIPAEWATLAAWMYIREACRQKNVPGPRQTSIDIPPLHGHKMKAKLELRYALESWFYETLNLLGHQMHPILAEKPTKPGSNGAAEDDLPF